MECSVPLFAALVNLSKERLEDFLLQTRRLINGCDLVPDTPNNIVLVLFVDILQVELLVQGLDLGLGLRFLAAVVLVKQFTLLRGATLQSLVDQPRALVVLDIGSNLANEGRVTVRIQVVVLDLEVLAQGNENVMGLAEVVGGSELEVVKCQRNGEVETVVGSLVGHNEHVLVHREVVQVHLVLRGRDQIALLTQLRLPGNLVEQFQKVHVRWVRTEVLLQDHIDSGLEHESVVDGNQSHPIMAVPAGLATTSDRSVHHVVTNQEKRLQKLCEPSQRTEMLELLVVEGLESQARVRDGETTVQLSTRHVGVEGLQEHSAVSSHPSDSPHSPAPQNTFSNHSNAFAGMLYFFACSTRSCANEEKTDSKSAREVVGAMSMSARNEYFSVHFQTIVHVEKGQFVRYRPG